MDRKRRSNSVLLSLIGVNCAVVIAAVAFPGTEMRRNLYSGRADCERDYSAPQCEQTNSSGGSSGGGYGSGGGHVGGAIYRGPAYAAVRGSAAADGDPGGGRVGLQTATETSYRGGFGQFGHTLARGC